MPVATVYSAEMANVVAGGGAIQVLNNANVWRGRQRSLIATIALAAQASGTVFGVARLPIGALFLGASYVTDTSLSTTTLAIGNPNSATAYNAATASYTTTNALTRCPSAQANTIGVVINQGWDAVTGLDSTGGGGGYTDIIVTTGVAALPASGTLRLLFEYAID